jgi:prepilin-type N-terminal cleavage/methylation domain-containing protein
MQNFLLRTRSVGNRFVPKTQPGFTLIELLVVIAIIGLLSSVVLASLNTARLKSRDARRLSDMHQIENALELYYNTNNIYPPHDVNTSVTPSLGALLAPAYISVVPKDPQDPGAHGGTSGYRYCTDGQKFTLLMTPEKTNAWCSFSRGADPCTWSVVYPACTP